MKIRESITLACKIVSETKRDLTISIVVSEAIPGAFRYSMFNRYC